MSGLAVKLHNVPVIQPFEVGADDDFCLCDFACEWEQVVFGDSGTDDHKKDYSSFLTRKLTASDTVEIKIIRNGEEVATITDSSLGEFYPTFAAQPLYVGFLLDWSLVLNQFGGGPVRGADRFGSSRCGRFVYFA